jgi:hypothetical protein
MIDVYNRLIEPTEDANSGYIIGNRNFYNNDYMVSTSVEIGLPSFSRNFQVQRGKGYVSTLKMYSTRTINTECLNSQNVRFALSYRTNVVPDFAC